MALVPFVEEQDDGRTLVPYVETKQNKGILGDIGTGLKRGVQQMPGMVTGLADIAAAPVSAATGINRPFSRGADWLGEQTGFQPGKWAEQAGAEYSPEMQQSLKNVEEAKGFFPTLGAIAQNPRVAANLVAESLPSTIAGGLLARGAMGAVAGAEKLAAMKAAGDTAGLLKAGAIAGGIGEGVVTAGQQMAQTDYGVDPLRAAGTALGAGAVTGAIGAGSGRLANSAIGKKLGLSDIETSIAAGTLGQNAGKAGALGYAKRVGAGALQEGLLEEATQSYNEQVWQNLANGKPWNEGAAEAAAQGAVAGGLMGGGINAIPRLNKKPEEEYSKIPLADVGIGGADQQQGVQLAPRAPASGLASDTNVDAASVIGAPAEQSPPVSPNVVEVPTQTGETVPVDKTSGPISAAVHAGAQFGAVPTAQPVVYTTADPFERLATLELLAEQRDLTPQENAEANALSAQLDNESGNVSGGQNEPQVAATAEPTTATAEQAAQNAPIEQPAAVTQEAAPASAPVSGVERIMQTRTDQKLESIAADETANVKARQAATAEIQRRATSPAQPTTTSPLVQKAAQFNMPAMKATNVAPQATNTPPAAPNIPTNPVANVHDSNVVMVDVPNRITGGSVKGELNPAFSNMHELGRDDAVQYWDRNRQNLGASGGQRPASIPQGPGMDGSTTNTQWKLAFHQKFDELSKTVGANEYTPYVSKYPMVAPQQDSGKQQPEGGKQGGKPQQKAGAKGSSIVKRDMSGLAARDDLIGAIMRITGNKGVSPRIALSITGDVSGAGNPKLRGFFKEGGTEDLSELVAKLNDSDEGYFFEDDAKLSEAINKASRGDVAKSASRIEEESAAKSESERKDYYQQRATELGLKKVGGKRTLDMVIADVEREEARLNELEANAERESIQVADAVDSAIDEGMTEADFMRWLSDDIASTYTEEDIQRAAQDQADREDARIEANAIADAEERAQENSRQGNGNQPATPQGSGIEAGARPAEGFNLAQQTNEQAAAQFAQQKAGEPKGITREQIKQESIGGAGSFSLAQQVAPASVREQQAKAKQGDILESAPEQNSERDISAEIHQMAKQFPEKEKFVSYAVSLFSDASDQSKGSFIAEIGFEKGRPFEEFKDKLRGLWDSAKNDRKDRRDVFRTARAEAGVREVIRTALEQSAASEQKPAQEPAQQSQKEETKPAALDAVNEAKSNPEMDALKAEMGQAIDELASILGVKNNLTPEEESRIIPVMSKIFRIAAKMGYIKFKEAAAYVLDQIRKLAGNDVADKISIENLQAGYINIAKEIGGDKREAMSYDSIEDLEKANVPDQRSGTNLESDSGNAEAQDGMGAQGVQAGRDGNGGTRGQGVQGSQGQDGTGSGGELRGNEAAAAGERGDSEIYTGATELSPGSAGNSVDFGSRDSGIEGTPVEPDAAEAIEESATNPLLLATEKAKQREADKSPHGAGLKNIREALPALHEGQQEDVAKAETRFAVPDGYGMLFTNGTGTGKTFTGLGVAKRFASQGKTNILIVAPNDKIIEDWQKSGKVLGLYLNRLESTNDAGKGIVITTYANMGQNNALASRDWDLVIHDEAHYLAMDKDGTNTNALKNLRAISLHPDGVYTRHEMQNAQDIARLKELDAQAKHERMSDDERNWYAATATQEKADKLRNELKAKQEAIKADVQSRQGAARPRVVFLSATPFAYEKTVDWANGYIFDYNEGRADERKEFRGYNQGSNHDQFFMQHFGYRMRYGKLTEPDAKVDRGLMQRQFNSWLKKKGSLSGRMLDVVADYDRRFILTESAIGSRIDEALQWFEVKRKEQHQGTGEVGERIGAIMAKADPYASALAAVRDHIAESFDYLSRRYLLESIKAKEVIPHIREHLALGRKVVVFHDYKKGGGFNPFKLQERTVKDHEATDATVSNEQWNQVVREFNAEFKDIIDSDLFRQSSPILMFQKEFPGVMLFNGDVPAKTRRDNVARFNDDATGPQVILVQSAAGKEGISLHDTTGKHQRVLFNLGQPTQPTTAIQQEGRIYRTGQVTNAIFRYLNTGTNWEKWAFATTIAQRASAAENLGMGELARALKDAFISGFEESDDYRAGMEGEGTGGKERDKAANDALTEYDRARAFYFGTQKKNSKTKAQEGADYFATPEPVGLKMVEFADIRPGERTLEPSAGHGAIARWFPETADKTAIEPSMSLRSRLAMVFDGTILDSDFESLNVVNKFDAIVMNPPFGTAGRTAIDHLAKAETHLRDGGRIVALLPTGPAADKKFDKWMYEGAMKPVKPIATVDYGIGAQEIFRGDTIKSRASWAPEAVITRRGDGGTGFMVKVDGKPGESRISDESITAVARTGPRETLYRPAEGIYMVADIKMPAVTFERAGTQVMTRIVVLEKQTDAAKAPNSSLKRDYSDVTDINQLFDRMEDLSTNRRNKEDLPESEQPTTRSGQPTREKPESAKVGDVVNVDGADYAIEIYTTNDGKDKRGIWMEERAAKAINPRAFKSSKMLGTPAEGKFFVDEYWLNKRKPASGNIVSANANGANKGAALYSRGESQATPMPQSAAVKSIGRIITDKATKALIDAGLLRFVNSEAQIPGGGKLMSAVQSDYGLPEEQPGNRTLNGTELASLRRTASRIERPNSGVFLRVTEDGRVVASGPKGTRVPETFIRFAEDNGLAFEARRNSGINPADAGKYKDSTITVASEPMPAQYRESGAMYFGETVQTIDRTGKSRFSNAGQILGATMPDGTIYLNLGALNEGNIEGVFKHEGFHSAARGWLGEQSYSALMKRLEQLRAVAQSKMAQGRALSAWYENANAAIPQDTREQDKLEELAGYAIEMHANGDQQPSVIRKWVEDFLSALRTAIIKYMPNGKVKLWALNNLKPQDLARMAVAGMKAKAGSMQAQGREAMAYSKSLPDTINVDGIDRPTTNSNGKLIHPTEEGIKNFWKWFGASSVVDADGNPLVVYHGTGVNSGSRGEFMSGDFDTFRGDLSGKSSKTGAPYGTFFFTDSPEVASSYTVQWRGEWSEQYKDRANVMPVFLSIKNPLKVSAKGENWREILYKGEYRDINEIAEIAKQSGKYDGVVVSRVKDYGVGKTSGKLSTTYIAFDPEQIKSYTGNTGTFDGSNPDIRYSRASTMQQPANQPQPTGPWQQAKAKFNSLVSPEVINTLIYNFQDKYVDLKNIIEHIKKIGGTLTDLNDVRLGEETYHSKAMKKDKDFLKNEIRPLFQQLLNSRIKKEELEQYLHARHAPEANRVLAERNPNQKMIVAGQQKASADLKSLQSQLSAAQASGAATKAIEAAIEQAKAESARWNGAQAFQGTEAERNSLSGMSNQKAEQIMDSVPAGKLAAMQSAVAKVDAIQAKTLAELEKMGLMDKASLDAWRATYQHYIPLHRDEAHPDSASHPVGQGFSIKGDASKRRVGSNEKVTNILGHIAMQREAAIVRGEKNSVSKRMYLLAKQNPIRDFWQVDRPPMREDIDPRTGFVRRQVDPTYKNKPNVLMVRIAGKDAAIVFNEHNPEAVRLAGALKNLDGQDLDVVERTIGAATRWIASVNTQYNPIFGLINFARDIQSAWLNLTSTELTNHKKAVWNESLRLFKEVAKSGFSLDKMNAADRALWEDFQDSGGATGYRDMFANPEDRAKALDKELNALNRGNVAKRFYVVADWLSNYNEAMENVVRMAAYKVGLQNGMSKERAASLAKNLTVNFNRKGAKAQKLGAFYAFFNASVQGTARMAQTLKGPAGKKIIIGGIALGVMQQMLGMLMMGGGDDDEWDKIPDFVKERSLVFPTGKDTYVAIPMPLGFNVLPNIGRLMAEWAVGGQDKPTAKQVGKLFNIMLSSLNPVGGNDLVDVMSPTVSDPVVSLLRNKDWTGKPIFREDMASLDPTPGFTRTKDTATPWARGISYVVNMATGGTNYQPGAVSWTPDQVDYVIGQLTGGAGRELGKFAQTISAPINGDELPVHKIPLVGRIVGSTAGVSGQSERFYENIRALNGIEREIKGIAKAGGDVGAYMDSEPRSSLVGLANISESQVKKLREAQRTLKQSGEAAGSRELDGVVAGIMRGLNTEVRAANQR